GQAVAVPGTAMSTTLRDVPMEKRVELPVAEDMQLGPCTGIALAGGLPICLYPRWNFLLLATHQLVLHLDKLPLYGNGVRPKVISRTAVATEEPLHPGPQHVGDFTAAYRAMLHNIPSVTLDRPTDVLPAYRWALGEQRSVLLVEHTRLYA